jgi:hypothetical protein
MLVSPAILESLSKDSAIAFVVDAALDIQHTNQAWVRSALRDGAIPLAPSGLVGRNYLDFVVGPLHELLSRKLHTALAPSTSAAGLLITSECNTPLYFQTLTTHVLPLRTAGASAEGLVLLHSLHINCLLSEREELFEEPFDTWRNAAGLLVQCGCCRRVRDARDDCWKMHARLVAEPAPNTSHGLCATCLEAYYPDA